MSLARGSGHACASLNKALATLQPAMNGEVARLKFLGTPLGLNALTYKLPSSRPPHAVHSTFYAALQTVFEITRKVLSFCARILTSIVDLGALRTVAF